MAQPSPPRGPPDVGRSAELMAALRRAGIHDADDSRLARALYSSDASLFRIPPLAVVRPRHRDEVAAVLSVCRDLGVPVTARGAGTSIAGNAIGPGVVLDYSRHLNHVLHVDAEARTAVVEPGTIHATLQQQALARGLRFGPDPSTHSRCTVGGMVGNNACGSRALGYGRTSDNVLGLDLLTASGERLEVGATAPASSTTPPLLAELERLVGDELAVLRTEFGRFGRQVSGYALEHLLPERGFDPARALVGSEGTLALVQEATVRLVEDPPYRLLVLLGFPDIAAAADAAPCALPFHPIACEGLDQRILAPLLADARQNGPTWPRGGGLLMVELAGDHEAEMRERADTIVRALAPVQARIITDPAEAAAAWRVREDGAGLAARTVDGGPAYSGWEDSAVPPDRLGAYLRDLDALLAQHHLRALPYGHFGDGCVHARIDFPFGPGGDRGRGAFRGFLSDAADLVARYGGSLSGEHGDGRARSALLGRMYSPGALAVQARVKRLFDPAGLLNPGVLVDPDAPDLALRTSSVQPPRLTAPIRLRTGPPSDAVSFTAAAHRCTGVAKCRADLPGTVMCPSYLATGDEKDSTRGRARVLQELAQTGSGIGWRSPEVHDVLDLCLACKACSRDCPTGVDIATLKAQTLHQRYAGRRRPRAHYTLGRLPQWADLAARAPRLVNTLTQGRLAPLVARLAGVDPRRSLPPFAAQTFQDQWRRQAEPASSGDAKPVALWVDSFTDHFAPHVAHAAVRVLHRAGYSVQVVQPPVCCGLTWLTTGQLETARARLAETVATLAPVARAGLPIVGLEPSCTAVLRGDAVDLLADSADGRDVAGSVRTLAELLGATPGWSPPALAGLEIVAQPHCHHYAVMGWAADAALLARAGATVTTVDGCCGLAGNWGAEAGHHDLSVAIAEQHLLPAVRTLAPGGVVLADGFSCRTQLAQLCDRRAQHLAELLDTGGQVRS